jgi:hypothetical protein
VNFNGGKEILDSHLLIDLNKRKNVKDREVSMVMMKVKEKVNNLKNLYTITT